MRRIIHNTTAVAACLSLLAPQFAQAQLTGAGAPVTVRDATGPAGEPIILAQAQQDEEQVKRRRNQQQNENGQRQRGERAQQRQERQAEQREQRQERAEQRQERQAEQREQRQERAEQRQERQQANPARQQANQERNNEARPRDADREQERRRPAEAERNREAQRPQQRANENQDRPRQRNAEQNDLDAAVAAERERRENRQERAQRQERRAAQEERQERREARERQERREEARERAERQERQENREERAERQERREAQEERQERREARERRERQEARQRSTIATGGMAQQRNESMQNMSKVLDTEVDRGLRDSDLRCVSGCNGNAPRYLTPEGALVVRNNQGGLVLAPREEQLYRVTNDGRFVRRAAEEDRRETELSREAARERRVADDVAALLNGEGRFREERITRDNYRRSDEDFNTSLRDALNDDRRDRRDDDGDDDNDLMKALLLGGGALAIGAMLNRNRQVALSSPDRVVLTRPDGSQEIVKDETALLRQPGSTVTTEEFDDGSTRTIVTRADGSKVVTIRDADLRVLRRSVVSPDGRTVRLIDDTQEVAPVDLAALPEPAPVFSTNSDMDEAALREALYQESATDRRFTLGQIRNVPEVRALAAPVNIDDITFDTGSAAINAGQAEQLASLGEVIEEAVAENPQEVFLIEGHTDTVGSDAANLALSDRRAESVALALSEYYAVPPENLIIQGYGEQYPSIRGEGDIRENRRASVRRITDLLQTAQE